MDFSTYLGGNGGDGAYGVATDTSGNAYVAGNTDSTDFPAPASHLAVASRLQATQRQPDYVFVAKLLSATPAVPGLAPLAVAALAGLLLVLGARRVARGRT
jgi:hypothetical protein